MIVQWVLKSRFPTPEDPSDVKASLLAPDRRALKFPIAVDNDQSNWNAWSNRYWPTVHVVDRRGPVLYGWEGELSYKGAPGEETVRKVIEALLLERP